MINIGITGTLGVKQTTIFLRSNAGFLKNISNKSLYNFFQFPCARRREKDSRWTRRARNNSELVSVLDEMVFKDYGEEEVSSIIFKVNSSLEENLFDLYFDLADFLDRFILDDITGNTELPFKIRKKQKSILGFVVELFNAREKKLTLRRSKALQIYFCFCKERRILDELTRTFIVTADSPPEIYNGLPGSCPHVD